MSFVVGVIAFAGERPTVPVVLLLSLALDERQLGTRPPRRRLGPLTFAPGNALAVVVHAVVARQQVLHDDRLTGVAPDRCACRTPDLEHSAIDADCVAETFLTYWSAQSSSRSTWSEGALRQAGCNSAAGTANSSLY